MKKIIVFCSLTILLFTGNIFPHNRLTGNNLAQFNAAVKSAYNNDIHASMILHLDIKGLKSTICSLDAKKTLSVQIPGPTDKFKLVCECNYLGLAFSGYLFRISEKITNSLQAGQSQAQLSLNKKIFNQSEINALADIIQLLVQHNVNMDAAYTLNIYEQKDGEWLLVTDDLPKHSQITNKNLLIDLITQFSPALNKLKSLL